MGSVWLRVAVVLTVVALVAVIARARGEPPELTETPPVGEESEESPLTEELVRQMLAFESEVDAATERMDAIDRSRYSGSRENTEATDVEGDEPDEQPDRISIFNEMLFQIEDITAVRIVKSIEFNPKALPLSTEARESLRDLMDAYVPSIINLRARRGTIATMEFHALHGAGILQAFDPLVDDPAIAAWYASEKAKYPPHREPEVRKWAIRELHSSFVLSKRFDLIDVAIGGPTGGQYVYPVKVAAIQQVSRLLEVLGARLLQHVVRLVVLLRTQRMARCRCPDRAACRVVTFLKFCL